MNRTKNVNESQRVGNLVGAKHKQCYINAVRVIWHVPEYKEADYVEGYAVIGGKFCIEHGWVELDNDIIDPTLPGDDIAYFPGVRFTGSFGISEALQIPKQDWCEDLPIFYRFGWGGIENPEFRSAIVAAYRYAGMEEIAKRYEEYGLKSIAEATVD